MMIISDKAMAMGIIQFAIGLFGNVPCPIIYGAVIDSTCLVWETICGKQGACSLYDPDAFRHFFLGTHDFLINILHVLNTSNANNRLIIRSRFTALKHHSMRMTNRILPCENYRCIRRSILMSPRH